MNHDHEHYHKPKHKVPWWKTSFGMAFIFFFVIAGYFLFMEHRAHIGNNWIWLILLVCPLIHKFMHSDHGSNNHSNSKDKEKR